ncbi:MAG: LLM class F420-dependent oxidoreductase [Armatimonadetes bacterium]|nr:LLM class F420-dependent oxidoreductase [Armatimonadota bacterium]
MAIRIGVQIHPQHSSYDDMAKAAQTADEQGFDTLWTWDHFYPLYGTEDAPLSREIPQETRKHHLHGAHFEGWTLLTAFAAITKRIEVGMLVTCNSYRNVNLLADMARTLDHVAHGRAILGIGSGWFEKDYAEYGFEFGTAGSRLKNLAHALPVLAKRLNKLHPEPVRHPMPIMIGGGGEKVTLKLVAQYASIWNYFGTPEAIAHKISVLDHWCKEVGRNPAEIERSILISEPEALDNLDAYYDAGIRHFIWGFGKPFDFTPAKRLMAWREARAAHR